MLLKLSFLLVVLGTASFGEPSARLCPKFCKCTYSSISQGIARCSTLDPEIQQNFPQDIRHLVVENDPYPKNITDSMFLKLGLKKLFSIKIVNSSVMSFDVNAFNGLDQLSDVNLADNRLMLIHPDTFNNNTQLKRLILSGNPLQLTQILLPIGYYVLRSESLSELLLSKCQMNQLSKRTFAELGNLDFLDLSHNSIRHIDPDVFIGLDQLEELDLSYNELMTIPSDTFSNIEDLLTLKLKGNPLQTFDLPNLPELKELDLSHCQFTYLGPETFEGVTDISNLNLSYNSIEKIDPDAFDLMNNLRYLDLSFNELKGPLDRNLLEPLTFLETLSFSGNKDLMILHGFTGEFSSLYFYDISDCGLKNLNSDMFKGMHYLASLNASGNDIQRIDPVTFSGLTHLNSLDLSNNQLHTLHPNLFASNHEMSKLYLSGNLFHHLSVPVFRPLSKLYTLDLSYNMISSLFNHSESQIMINKNILGQLTNLNVAGNYIKHIHIFNFASMVHLQVLDISENPIECTVNFNRVIKWLSAHRIIPNAAQYSHPIRMALEDKVENYRKWVSMLDAVCPIDSKSFEEVTSENPRFDNNIKDFHDPDASSLKDEPRPKVVTSDNYVTKHMGINDDTRYEVVEMTDDPNAWPTLVLLTVSCGLILVAVINIALVMFFRAKRNYSLVGYKSTYSGGPMPQSRFPLRKGHRNAYQKLYEDCSVPHKTPIVKGGKRLSVISVFNSHTDVPPQPV